MLPLATPILLTILALAGCSDDDEKIDDGTGGVSADGGTTSRGGTTGTAGRTSTLGGSAGRAAAGSGATTAGATSNGGASGSAGATQDIAGSSNNGGAAGNAGNAGTAGMIVVTFGGTVATGGTAAVTGGSVSTGGTVTATGGSVAQAGTVSTGGTATTAGSAGTSGSIGTGGNDAAGAATTAGTANTAGTTSVGEGGAAGATVGAGGAASVGGASVEGGGTAGTAGADNLGGGAGMAGAAGTAGTGGGPTVPTLLMQYDFDDGTGTTAVDTSLNDNDATVTDAGWSTAGRNGGAVNFDTATSVVTPPSGRLAGSHELTITAWVNMASGAANNRLFYFGDGTRYLTLVLNNATNGLSLSFNNGTTTGTLTTETPTQLPTGVWKHVTVTVSATSGSAIYIDGKIVASNAALRIDPATLGATTLDLIGNSPTAGEVYQGLMDEFFVYNYVLPLSDIRLRAWPKNDYSIYHFDENTGTTAADSSGRNITGTLMGGATWVPGPFGSAVKLDNPTTAPAQQYVNLGPDGIVADCTVGLTVAAWMRLESNVNLNAPLFEFAQDATHYVNMTTFATNSNTPPANVSMFSLGFYNNTSRGFRNTSYPWDIGTWAHVAVVREGATGGTGRLYRDGVQVMTGAISTGAALSSYNLGSNNFGKAFSDATAGFDASLDEILVSCRPYTADEIKHLAYHP